MKAKWTDAWHATGITYTVYWTYKKSRHTKNKMLLTFVWLVCINRTIYKRTKLPRVPAFVHVKKLKSIFSPQGQDMSASRKINCPTIFKHLIRDKRIYKYTHMCNNRTYKPSQFTLNLVRYLSWAEAITMNRIVSVNMTDSTWAFLMYVRRFCCTYNTTETT